MTKEQLLEDMYELKQSMEGDQVSREIDYHTELATLNDLISSAHDVTSDADLIDIENAFLKLK